MFVFTFSTLHKFLYFFPHYFLMKVIILIFVVIYVFFKLASITLSSLYLCFSSV